MLLVDAIGVPRNTDGHFEEDSPAPIHQMVW